MKLSLAIVALLFAASAHAQPDPLVAQLATVRQQGCPAHAGTAAPLQAPAELARAAQRVASGEAAMAAAQKEGYRAKRVFQMHIKGYRQTGDVVQAISQIYCDAITNPAFTDVGVYERGSEWLVLLAVRFSVPQDRGAAAAKVLALVNQARAQARRCGTRSFDPAPPLRPNALLEQAAARHAQDMAAHEYLEHEGRDGSTPAQRITRTGYRWRTVGENIAAGQPTPAEVVQDWIASPGHCANLMNGNYAETGIAFAVNMNAKAVVYWAQEFGLAR